MCFDIFVLVFLNVIFKKKYIEIESGCAAKSKAIGSRFLEDPMQMG